MPNGRALRGLGDTRPSASLAEAYDRHADAVYSLALAIGRDPQLAADVTQATFRAAAGGIDDVDPVRVRPWLLAAARTRMAQAVRGRAAARRAGRGGVAGASGVTAPGAAAVAAAAGGDAGAAVVEGVDRAAHDAVPGLPGTRADEVEALLSDPVAGLDDRDRAVLHLGYRQELRGAELAEALGVAPGTVTEMLGRARRRLEISVGALLVARRGRQECEVLDALLDGWDGRFTPLWRGRVARHVDGCVRCTRLRGRLLSPLAMGLVFPLALAPEAVRAAVLQGVAAATGGSSATAASLVPAPTGTAVPGPVLVDPALAGGPPGPAPGLLATGAGLGVVGLLVAAALATTGGGPGPAREAEAERALATILATTVAPAQPAVARGTAPARAAPAVTSPAVIPPLTAPPVTAAPATAPPATAPAATAPAVAPAPRSSGGVVVPSAVDAGGWASTAPTCAPSAAPTAAPPTAAATTVPGIAAHPAC